jgi:aromatic-L-amino-acid decarboxylase
VSEANGSAAESRDLVTAPDHEARSYHLTPDQLRAQGAQVLDWVARYQETVEQHPVLSQVAPGDVRAQLPAHPPEHPEPFDQVLADLDEIILPGITHWQSPSFFAYFPANASGPSILGDLVSSGLGVQGMLWSTSPACTELETHMLDWMVELLDLPDRFLSTGPGGGVIQDSASGATLCALLAARVRAGTIGGSDLDPLRAYTSTQAHSSLQKAVRIAGLRGDQLRLIDTDDRFAMRPDLLREAVEADLAAGLKPFFVMATAGTTSSLAFDPVAAVGEIAAQHGMWLHVDGAMAGSAAVVPDLRWVNEGLDRADSYAFNPHKWLFTNFDCDCFWVADRQPLLAALSILPEYLRNAATDAGAVIDYRDWHVPLGRRFRSLKLWFVLRHYGAEGLRHHVAHHVQMAQALAETIGADPRFELAAPVDLNLVCFRHVDGDEAGQALLEAINASGDAYLTHTKLDGRYVLRLCVGQTNTEQRHVDAVWELIDRLA